MSIGLDTHKGGDQYGKKERYSTLLMEDEAPTTTSFDHYYPGP